jgi:hypothetical protein
VGKGRNRPNDNRKDSASSTDAMPFDERFIIMGLTARFDFQSDAQRAINISE